MKGFCAFFFLVLMSPSANGQADSLDVVRTATPAVRGLAETEFPRVQQVADGVYTFEALTGPPDDRYTTNTMFVVTNEGVLVADGQGNEDDTGRLVEAIAKITSQPITHVVICSDHGDHTNGNGAFPDNVTFIAQRNSVAALSKAQESDGIMPDVVIDERLDLELGERNIQILFLGRAHTGGDLFVYLPEEKILFTSEVFLNHMFSGYRSAYPSEWLVTMDKAERIDADVLLPGHGFIDNGEVLREEWFEYKAHLQTVLDEVKRLYSDGTSVEVAIEKASFGRFDQWSGAESQGPIGVRRIYAELNGLLD